VLDKTGTITQGQPVVTDISLAKGVSRAQFLTIAASLEFASEHPLAQAIAKCAEDEKILRRDISDFAATPGAGVSASLDGMRYHLGNRRILETLRIEDETWLQRAESFAQQGKTPLFLAEEHHVLGVLAAADLPKPTAKEAISRLQADHLDVVLLTGDNLRTANAIAHELNITQVQAELFPQDKERIIRELQQKGRKVAMVGDGINDAPALTRADIGIAIGAGTDIAIEAADVVLAGNDLNAVAEAVELSRATIRNIRMNLFWALFYNACGIPLAAGSLYPVFGWLLKPVFGAAAMSCSSFCVVSNALRLRFFHHTQKQTVSPVSDNPRTIVLEVEGMMCGHCVSHVKTALESVPGVQSVQVSLAKNNAVVQTAAEVTVESLVAAVTAAGYQATLQQKSS
ncbi:MAG: HAD-IC family P-type ATPase, partial [Victivallales bacterium]|nr:HAD-IC family P-type ATPase [Victivallales bacterium]